MIYSPNLETEDQNQDHILIGVHRYHFFPILRENSTINNDNQEIINIDTPIIMEQEIDEIYSNLSNN